MKKLYSSDERMNIEFLHPKPIRSERIRSDLNFGTKIFISDWIGLIKLFRSRIGSDFDIRNKMN